MAASRPRRKNWRSLPRRLPGPRNYGTRAGLWVHDFVTKPRHHKCTRKTKVFRLEAMPVYRDETSLLPNASCTPDILCIYILTVLDFLDSSDGKKSSCNAGDKGSIPGSARSPGGGLATHSSILACRIPWSGEPGSYSPWGHQFSSDSCPMLKALVLVHFAGEN